MTARPERVAAEEVRQRMLAAGRELALEAGAALTIEHLRLEEVIQRARVPRSSVYRMWPYREEYIDDLLIYLAGEGSWFSDRPVLDPETFDVASAVVTDNMRLLATPEGRRSLMCEVVRIICQRNYEVLTDSTHWRLHMALASTLGSTRSSGDARWQIAAALEDSQRRSRESIVNVLRHLATVLGVRLRDPAYTLDHVQLAGGLLVQALALRNVQVNAALSRLPADDSGTGDAGTADAGTGGNDPGAAGAARAGKDGDGQDAPSQDGSGRDGRPEGHGVDLSEPSFVNGLLNAPIPGPGLHGEPAPWTLVAYAYLGLVDAFMELDPDFDPPSATGPVTGPGTAR